ncbi:HAD-IA family hydrolase [Antarcticirhabdus aurantiaca]|uniref:HAD-IA family hydrolase n=1 Tax=Antarcticirhabdus aurantiaca TaxID=2606717 RepID=A0ACD4NVL4_9HYPH|nr:HAD-IA family hydrolase [Antarcticirhabdus aurantiaca]WAJ30842.1 HAD-IA family hydrolase [Jeongeuplla avenae]
MRAILFDCDGTIADSFGLICEVMRRAFLAHGLAEPGDAATRAIIGLSLEEAMARLHPAGAADEHTALAERYRAAFRAARQDVAFRETLFEGMEDLVRRLAARDDVAVGLVTGKSRRGVAAIVESHGLDGIFLAVRTADDCPSKPHPAMVLECCSQLGCDASQALVIGDAVFDVAMARSAGAEAIGVSWGASTPAELLALGARAVAGDVGELERLIGDWLAAGSIASERRSAAG